MSTCWLVPLDGGAKRENGRKRDVAHAQCVILCITSVHYYCSS